MNGSQENPIQIYEGTATQAWRQAFEDRDNWSLQIGRNGTTRERLRAVFHLPDPRQRWVASREPPINVAFAIAECCWIINGDDSLAYLDRWNSKYKEFVGESERVYGAYGRRLRRAFQCDQLIAAGRALSVNPQSRQVVLQIYHPAMDLPDESGSERSKDIPCNTTSLLKIRDGKLEWTQILRSNDLCRGVPYNIVQFTSLQEVLAGIAGVEVGSYTHFADSLHMYDADEQGQCYASANADLPPNGDDLRLPIDKALDGWQALHAFVGALGRTSDAAEVSAKCVSVNLDEGLRSLALVCGSERLRRLGKDQGSLDLLRLVPNPALRRMQERWHEARGTKS